MWVGWWAWVGVGDDHVLFTVLHSGQRRRELCIAKSLYLFFPSGLVCFLSHARRKEFCRVTYIFVPRQVGLFLVPCQEEIAL